jgi:transposase
MELAMKYKQFIPHLNEKQRRLYVASEALAVGEGGITRIHKASGISRVTITRGIRELKGNQLFPQNRIREAGGGRKRTIEKDPRLLTALEALVAPATKGDPMRKILWTDKSTRTLSATLSELGFTISHRLVRDLLLFLGFSLKANKKNIEGISHPDRNAQFEHINKTCKTFEDKGNPIISVDCKKKELIGNFKNNGREWQSKGQNTVVNVYDFKSLADGKAVPYGIYDVIKNSGFVNVGVDHDTASFAVESIRRWWQTIGKKLYPTQTELLITSDGGGSNGVKNRLWKKELQQLSNETNLTITVTHLPPATSKWNKIEHRLFSFISINWRAKPLTNLETIIELLNHTTTKEGLTVKAMVDQHAYPTKVKVSNEEFNALNIVRDSFHGDWNYTIKPQNVNLN